jgi:hypothetical protein
LAGSDEENCRRDALVSLGNLAVNAKNQLMICKIGGLPVVSASLESGFESVQRFACRVLYRLTAHALIQSTLVDVGAIPSINRLLHRYVCMYVRIGVYTYC